MGMNISMSVGNYPLNGMFTGGMLKSTREKMERKQQCDNMVALYENKISSLKNMEADSLEDISRKLELLHTYQDSIAAAKQEYNRGQMFHVLDEAREKGEKIAEAAEDMKPKTAEERREDMIEEALGTEDKGGILDALEEIADMAEELREETLKDQAELAEEFTDKVEETSSVLPAEMDQDALQTKDVLPIAGNDPVKVTLSKAGMEYYRQKLQKTSGISVDEITKQKEILSKLSMSAEDGMETQFHDRLVDMNGVLDKGKSDRDQLMGNCLSVYKSMRDEIKQGYENGTREKWIADGDITAGGSYRKLTEEEEIAALDKAFNFYSGVIKGYSNYGIKAGQDVQQAMENTGVQLTNQKTK